MNKENDEDARRDKAQAHREVIEGSGRPLEPAVLEQMVSVRLDSTTVAQLRELATARAMTMSALIREALDDYAATDARRSRFEWTVTSYEGMTQTQAESWSEENASQAALREVGDHAGAA